MLDAGRLMNMGEYECFCVQNKHASTLPGAWPQFKQLFYTALNSMPNKNIDTPLTPWLISV